MQLGIKLLSQLAINSLELFNLINDNEVAVYLHDTMVMIMSPQSCNGPHID